MYDELILKLREDAEFLKISSRYNNTKNEFAERILQAVDAIESMSKAYQMIAEAYESEVTKHCWIPVTELLPNNEDMVIFHYAWTGRSGTVYKEVTLATLAELEQVGNKPLAWMPLPEPPKEES